MVGVYPARLPSHRTQQAHGVTLRTALHQRREACPDYPDSPDKHLLGIKPGPESYTHSPHSGSPALFVRSRFDHN